MHIGVLRNEHRIIHGLLGHVREVHGLHLLGLDVELLVGHRLHRLHRLHLWNVWDVLHILHLWNVLHVWDHGLLVLVGIEICVLVLIRRRILVRDVVRIDIVEVVVRVWIHEDSGIMRLILKVLFV